MNFQISTGEKCIMVEGDGLSEDEGVLRIYRVDEDDNRIAVAVFADGEWEWAIPDSDKCVHAGGTRPCRIGIL